MTTLKERLLTPLRGNDLLPPDGFVFLGNRLGRHQFHLTPARRRLGHGATMCGDINESTSHVMEYLIEPNASRACEACRQLATPGAMPQGTSTLTRAERIDAANAVIEAISDHGRRFFHYRDPATGDERVTRIEQTLAGRLVLIDCYTGARVAMVEGRRWKGFTQGGTMRRLVEELVVFIRAGRLVRPGHFALAPTSLGHEPGSNIWGYDAEAFAAVQVAVIATGAVAQPGRAAAPNPKEST